MDSSVEENEEEQNIFCNIIAAFKCYRKTALESVNRREAYVNSLPKNHQEMLTKYRELLQKLRCCIEANDNVIKHIVQDADCLFYNDSDNLFQSSNLKPLTMPKVRPQDIQKVTLKQIFRDWSIEGQSERNQCYKPIIDEITTVFSPLKCNVEDIKILVPGAGLGRLVYEIACRGYYCEGNEFSLFMLIASNFVLNRCIVENQCTFYPWVHQYVNNLCRNNQIKSVTFPDVSPTKFPPKGTMNMVAGDFLQVYKDLNYWDCIATCFFIDCANNIIEFVELIYSILKPGGIWINLGPLLYHFSDIIHENSIEPTYEDIMIIVISCGFKILKNRADVPSKYAQNPTSMHQSEYNSIYLVCEKPDSVPIEMKK
ncbi:carnosine N-methyltransferase isoform X2 [Malaya genurostris]|uniref:carnosine N-methyltransferase isoform X2 n=1 Tax=Malaya genurostris TaxID=325434 RepID=UPI0026F3F6F1|nr:carnosine N-methyltransferase isoform X2 [Malaya genurostris]